MVILDRIDPFSAEFQQDPFPYYHAMRETSPAWHLPGTDLHFVTRFDVASAVLRDTETFSSAYGATANEPPGAAPRGAAGGHSAARVGSGRRRC